ncbi:MAG: type IX secretion system sortase PorU [Ignavibacteria bacterium]
MTASKSLLILLSIFFVTFNLSSQNSKRTDLSIKEPVHKNSIVNNPSGNGTDYKIISSNNSYLEIELYPQYEEPTNIDYNGEKFVRLNFENSSGPGIKAHGQPDLAYRILAVILPSESNNTVSVTDYDVKEVQNIDLAPVPDIEVKEYNKDGIGRFEYKYLKDTKAYSQNKFLPEKLAYLGQAGLCRELTVAGLMIHPYSYNPVSRILMQYTRIRIRINFGQSPVPLNRKRRVEENNLLKDIAVNSHTALNWMSPKLLTLKPLRITGNSYMSTGDWYRIEIQDNGSGNSEGIYKMNKTFLESAGMNLNNVDPRTIKMYGNGGDMLPDNITLPRPDDLTEIAIYIDGQDDGHFDPQDYILFYGKSVNNWKYDITYGYSHYLNTYSKSNYYWICINTPSNGKRMPGESSEYVQNPYVPTSFIEKLFYEPEEINLINEGNVWLSEGKFSGQAFTWNNTLTGLQPNSNTYYRIKAASRSFCPYENHMLLQEAYSYVSPVIFVMGCVPSSGYENWIWTGVDSFSINASQKNPTNSEHSSFVATYYSESPGATGYVDWMEILYSRRYNSITGDIAMFDSPTDNTGVIEYNVSPFSSDQIKVFDATEHDSVKIILPLTATPGNVKFQRSTLPNGQLSKFFVAGPNGYKTPASISQRVPNQNLHGGYSEGASFIIITHNDFIQAANRLKAKRESGGPGNPNYLKTYVFDVQSIYNEFSGGLMDAVAIRDFLKYCYDHWTERPSYVCLFGDGSFDYKEIISSFSNWVPAYEYSDPYINQTANYCSDDFYVEVSGDDPSIDIAIGRIPVRSIDKANDYLDKIDCYEDPSYNGYWKNRLGFVADDGDEGMHVFEAEELSESHTPGAFDKIKMYLPSYPTIITPQGRRKPGVNEDIVKYWNEGLLSLHYIGHGSPEQWAVENVLEKEDIIARLNNTCRYPFVSIASCDFSKFDNPLEVCGGEMLAITPRKAAIGTLGATRPTVGETNAYLFDTFWDYYLGGRDTLLYQWRFSKALFAAKQICTTANDHKFVLLCDPSLRPQRPRFISRIDSIRGLSGDTMRALSRITIFGSILRPDSSVWADYNGRVVLKAYDVTRQVTITDEGITYIYKLPGGIIFSGEQNVSGGRWLVQYIVPKDISYLNRHGKIIDYFYNNQNDGAGMDSSFIVGGIDPSAPVDTTGPLISLFINSRNFKNGDVVNENFKLLGDLYDESGINTTGTIGHKLEAVMDNNYNNKYDLTNFYNSDTTYKSGHFAYDFSGVPDGHHTIKVKAWDTYNNSSEASIDFIVSSYTSLHIMNIYNYPNPFRDRTSFTFQHNYPGNINVTIKIYTVSGRLIKELKQVSIPDKFVAIDWDGKDADGETLANGVYLYKVMVTSDDGSSQSSIGKMAVLK